MVLRSVLISFFYLCICAKSLQSCPNLCNPMDYSPPVFSIHGILQAGILDWVSPPPRVFLTQGSKPHLLCLPALKSRFFTSSAIWEALILHVTVHFSQYHLPKRLSLFHCIFWAYLAVQWLRLYASTTGGGPDLILVWGN